MLLQFCGLDCVFLAWWGSNHVWNLSQRETRWIFLLKSLTPRGLNIELDRNCFNKKMYLIHYSLGLMNLGIASIWYFNNLRVSFKYLMYLEPLIF